MSHLLKQQIYIVFTQLFYFFKKPIFKYILLTGLYFFLMYAPLRSLLSQSIPHWFDTAWALLIGLENQQKIQLIGFAGGIPGIHYGPHWFWMISLVQLVNRNPAVITAVLMFIPYFTLFPYLFYKFSKVLGTVPMTALWVVYLLTYQSNAVHLWQIHLVPIVFLAILYLLTTSSLESPHKKEYRKIFLVGILCSFAVNIHWSFGTVIFLSTSIFLISIVCINLIKQRKKAIIPSGLLLFLYSGGFLLSHSPFIVFELRHDFYQTKNILYMITQSVLYNSAVVGQKGFSHPQIVDMFLTLPLELLQLPRQFFYSFWLIVVYILSYLFLKRKLWRNLTQLRLIWMIVISTATVLTMYLSSKNPIWSYHFIGAEILFVVLVGYLAYKVKPAQVLLVGWISYVTIKAFVHIATDKPPDPLSLSTLITKRTIVESIYRDAASMPFSVFAYSPSIYTYDYDYLFKWLGTDIYRYMPQSEPTADMVYLIIPTTYDAIKYDFIHYKSPPALYQTTKEWQIADGTSVVKRMKISPVGKK